MLDSMRQGRVLRERGHRPWPVPTSPWAMAQTWESLLFAHWRVPAEALQRVMPPQLRVDTFDGSAWLGVTPFRVGVARARRMPHIPGVTSFPELNVRTYTTLEGRPGIWFFSLDAASRAAVTGARRTYRLPYFHARMSIDRRGDEVAYRSRRDDGDGPPAEAALSYRPSGPAAAPAPGTLEHFLTERYCLYTLDEENVLRADIHHPPWPLQPAEASWERNSMGHQIGLDLDGEQPLLHFAARQDVLIWLPSPCGG